MKLSRHLLAVTVILFCSAARVFAADALIAAPAVSLSNPPSALPTPQSKDVLALMERVADWQLAHPSKQPVNGWVQGAGYAGMMALADLLASPRFRDAMRTMAAANDWKPAARVYHADDTCVGQTYLELYLHDRDPAMIAPLRARFDAILAAPPSDDLDFTHAAHNSNWSWCDALFMAPPAWARMTAATHDPRYVDYAVAGWWRTSDYLYDKTEHLYFRDSTYFKKTEANGKKVFWSRGNGWVMGGLVRMLQFLPADHPERARFETQFKEMADAILAFQQDDGLWRSSLLDPASYPAKETSGSGFYTYALTWGVNQKLLDAAKFKPAVLKAWAALGDCVQADGKLIHVQPVGADPKKFDENATEPYGTGAFLLAGSEIFHLAVPAAEAVSFRK